MGDDLIARLREGTILERMAADALEVKDKRIAELEEILDATQRVKDARIAELEALLKPFAQLNAQWFGDKMSLQPKSILLDPLPVLYASKYFSEPEK